jgi:hypothetical protein
MAMKKAIFLLLLVVFALTSAVTVEAVTLKNSSKSVHLGRAQPVHVSGKARKHRKHKKHKKHHKRKKHRNKRHKNNKKKN